MVHPSRLTLAALSLGAGVGTAPQRASAVRALARDVAQRGDHLTVGSPCPTHSTWILNRATNARSAGQKWLLRTLSDEGEHETALRLAMQTTQPSWGYWLSQVPLPRPPWSVRSWK